MPRKVSTLLIHCMRVNWLELPLFSRRFMSYTMQNSRRMLPLSRCVKRLISRFPELKYDGTVIHCSVCKRNLIGWDAYNCKRHVESASHKRNRDLKFTYGTFLCDFVFMLSVCDIPQYVLDKPHFRIFWEKYIPQWPLPTRQQVVRRFHHVIELLENNIRRELHAKPLWLTVDETTDAKNNKVGNVVVRVLHANRPSESYLIASKRLENCNAAAIEKLVLETLSKFNIHKHNVLMLVTDGAAYMLKAGASLKNKLPNLLHVTCLLHAIHLVAETVRNSYPLVNDLIASTKKVFTKSPKRIQEFHRACPQIPDPPQPVFTRWGTWLQAAFYYFKYFEQIKSVVSKFDYKDAASIKSSQLFANEHVMRDLQTIHTNYEVLLTSIEEMQKTSLSLEESCHIIDNLNVALQTLTDDPGVRAAEKLKNILHKNPDYVKMRSSIDSIRNRQATKFQQNFAYAIITSLDVERSFSRYSAIFSQRQRCLSADTVEGLLMMQVYAQTHLPLMDTL